MIRDQEKFFDENLKQYFSLNVWLIPISLSILLVIINSFNHLLFHSLAELFAIIVAILMSVVVWNTYPFTRNNFLMYLGCGYFWIGGLDIMHTLSYAELNIFANNDGNVGIQYWIGTRYIEAFLLVTAPVFLTRELNRKQALIAYGLVSCLVVVLIQLNLFPDTFINGQGLTTFKIASEYFIIAMLAIAIFLLRQKKEHFDKHIIDVMSVSIVFTMVAELNFTYYTDFLSFSLVSGHIFKLFSFWLIFIAIIRTTLKEPFLVMSQNATTYNAVPDATIVVDEKGDIRQANYAAARLANIEAQDMIGRNNHDIFHPDNISQSQCPVCRSIKEKNELSGLELKINEKGDWYDFSLSVISGHEDISGTVEVIRDISNAKQAEIKSSEADLLKNSIVESLPLVLFVKDIKNEFRYVEFNRTAEDVTGISKQEILGQNDKDLWTEEEAEFFLKKDMEVAMGGKVIDIAEEPITTRFNGVRILHTLKIPINDEHDEPKYLLGISEDITEKLQTEAMLRRSQKMEAIGQMSGGIAHDFNNQLGVILGYVDLLKDMEIYQSHKDWVDAIQAAADRCADLTRQLLMFSRNTDPDKKSVNLNIIIDEMKVMISRSVTPEVEVTYIMSEDLGTTEINPGSFQDCLLNLVINARDAMPGGGVLTIKTSNEKISDYKGHGVNLSPGEYIKVEVRDNGKGMPTEVSEHIFEPFYTTKEVGKGTGLGLSMVYGFVKRFHGDIMVDSSPGEGTSFKIYLPRFDSENQEGLPVHIKNDSFRRGDETILVVDDEPALILLAESILKNWDYKVLTAKNAHDALEIIKTTSVDLIFSDIVMPGGMDGYDLADKVLELKPGVKILLTSGYTDKNRLEETEHEFTIISKPYKRKELSDMLKELLD